MQIPFLVYGCFALTVLIFELRRIRARRRATGAAATARLFPSAYPTVCSLWVCVLAWGTALDNARIFIGGFDPAFSDSYVMKVVTYLCFFVHDVLLPPALIVPTELMLAALTTHNESWSQTTVRDLARLGTAAAVVGLTLLGLDQFLAKVPDKLELTTSEFPRPFHEKETFVMHSWGLSAKATQLDLLGVMVLSGWSLVCSMVVLWKLHWPMFFVLQLAALAGQAAGPVSDTYFFFASNFWEQVFLLSFAWAGARIWDRPIATAATASIQVGDGQHQQSWQQPQQVAWPVSGAAAAGAALPRPFGVAEKDPGAGVAGLVRSGSGDEEDVFHDVSTGETPRASEGRLTDPLLTRI